MRASPDLHIAGAALRTKRPKPRELVATLRRSPYGEGTERTHQVKCLALAGLPRIVAEPDADPCAVLLGGIEQQAIDVARVGPPAHNIQQPTNGLCRHAIPASSGCSVKFDFDSMTPGIMVLPSGSFARSNRVHSCAWRGLAASNEIARLKAAGFWGSGYWGVPKIRALFETTYLAGLRKAGMPEE
jgi:hypothetical protein